VAGHFLIRRVLRYASLGLERRSDLDVTLTRLLENLGIYAGDLAGQVRVLSKTNAQEFLPEALSSFLATHPHVSVDLEERLSDEIVGLMGEGVGDLGIVAATVD
jgi:DNA-binding transcriptional LysR family regulator